MRRLLTLIAVVACACMVPGNASAQLDFTYLYQDVHSNQTSPIPNPNVAPGFAVQIDQRGVASDGSTPLNGFPVIDITGSNYLSAGDPNGSYSKIDYSYVSSGKSATLSWSTQQQDDGSKGSLIIYNGVFYGIGGSWGQHDAEYQFVAAHDAQFTLNYTWSGAGTPGFPTNNVDLIDFTDPNNFIDLTPAFSPNATGGMATGMLLAGHSYDLSQFNYVWTGSGRNQVLQPAFGASDFEFRVDSVPEPSSLALVGLGVAGLFVASRRSRMHGRQV